MDAHHTSSESTHKHPATLILLVSFISLMLEILLVRLLTFFLSSNSTYLAIPITLFGLGLGSLLVHSRSKIKSEHIYQYTFYLSISLIACLIACFYLFNNHFNVTLYKLYHPYDDALKQITFCTILIIPFVFLGTVFATIFKTCAGRIGKFYGFDLLGTAVACFTAPLLLRMVGMHHSLLFLIAISMVTALVANPHRRKRLFVFFISVFCLVLSLFSEGMILREFPQGSLLGNRYLKEGKTQWNAEEVGSIWNDLSRVSLMRLFRGEKERYEIIHDAGSSYVHLKKYDKDLRNSSRWRGIFSLPTILNPDIQSVLIMFAGIGRGMVIFNEQTKGQALIHGVEINPGLQELLTNKALEKHKLAEFLELPNVNLFFEEGRSYLDRSQQKYDLIFVSSNFATNAMRSGHTRRFLDTKEALEEYIEHLTPNGVLLFAFHPIRDKAIHLRDILQVNKYSSIPFENKIIWLSDKRRFFKNAQDYFLVKPAGFTKEETQKVLSVWKKPKRSVESIPFVPSILKKKKLEKAIAKFNTKKFNLPTDDRPYQRRLPLDKFSLTPPEGKFHDRYFTSGWIRMITPLVFWILVPLTLLFFHLLRRKQKRMPAAYFIYFLLTGIFYMVAEIGLLSKLELFIGNPLYALAVILATFLLCNGVGSFLFDLKPFLFSPLRVALSALICLIFSLFTIEWLNLYLLHLPLWQKIPFVFLVLAPFAMSIGVFYPMGVQGLNQSKNVESVPMSFGIATLSSVLGSTYALVVIIEIGFRNLILQGVAGYAFLAIAFFFLPNLIFSAKNTV